MTIHLFVLQSLVSAALYTHVKQGGGPENQRISYSDLHAQVYFLSQLFRGEFIFPTEGLDYNLKRTLDGLEADDIIKITRSTPEIGEVKAEWIELSDAERNSGRENFDFYCFLIWPFIEAAWLGAMSLMMLTPAPTTSGSWLDLKKVQERAQLFGKTLYHQGDLSYFEAVNKETLKNAYTRFEEEGMILVTKGKDKVPSTIRLADDWTPVRGAQGIIAEGPLWRFAEKISLSRREGKNRRDGATVQSRVLKLADIVGESLWENAVLGKGKVDKEEVRTTEAKARRSRGGMARL
jgi:hypothetical protein